MRHARLPAPEVTLEPLILYIGEKNSSSWSMRGWLALAHKGLPFEERLVRLVDDVDREQRLAVSPTGLLPVLHHGPRVVPDSLAIIEYLEETFPPPRHPALWPLDPDARARARWLAATMHSGFAELRAGMSFHLCFWKRRPTPPAAALDEARELLELLEQELGRERAKGPFLLGAFGAVDAMYAPALVRLHAFDVPLGPTPRAASYMQALLALPLVARWLDAARALPPIERE